MTTSRTIDVLGHTMAYRTAGTGDPIVLLHGNPTSSYLWRNVIPHLSGLGRCIAPDLIGMGSSSKLAQSGDGAYGFDVHRRHLDALLEALDVRERVTLVVHDWGGALGFDWARRHPTAVRGIAYMETIVRPRAWSEWPEPVQQTFRMLRSPAGEAAVLERNQFVENIPRMVQRALTDEEMDAYRAPFRTPGEDRRPTLDFPRMLPIGGEPADVVAIVQRYADWLRTAPVPKLFVNAEPGASLSGALREHCRTLPHQSEVTVRGLHYLQEDSPHEIGEAIAAWMREIPQSV